jgi:hypothetical protein
MNESMDGFTDRFTDGSINKLGSGLHDIELAPLLSDSSLWLLSLGLIIVVLLASGIHFWHKRQQPLAKAIRQLKHLDNQAINPAAISAILRHALQLKHLNRGDLPADFVQNLQYAQFSASPISMEHYQALKQQAISLLQQHLLQQGLQQQAKQQTGYKT